MGRDKRKREANSSFDEATGSSPQPANDKVDTHHPHDKFVKCAFNNKEIAIDFFAAHLADKGLRKQDLKNFTLSSNEHQQSFKSSLADDIVYHGQIASQNYYIILEHQSSRDKTMLVRLLDYTVSLMKRHAAQGHLDLPVILPICLYHDTAAHCKKNHGKSTAWGYPTRLDSYFSVEHANRSGLSYEFKLVDLTAITDEVISTHGHAAIIEWLLKHASLPDDTFLQQAAARLTAVGHSTADISSSDVIESICEYIITMYDGDKSKDELLKELYEVMPQGGEFMGKLADKLRAEGRIGGIQEGMHRDALRIAQRMMGMLDRKIDLEAIKECTELPEEELAQFSPNRTDSTPPSRTSEGIPSANLLLQGTVGLTESGTSGETHKSTPGDHARGTFSPVHKKHNVHP